MTVYRQAPAVAPSASPVAVTWVPRDEPLVARGAVAQGDVATDYALRLLTLRDDALRGLRGVAGDGLLVVTAERLEVPWFDGLRWMGRDPDAPNVWLPTTERPSVSAALIERVLSGRAGLEPSPWMIWCEAGRVRVVSLATARALDRSRIESWLEGH